jgi:hypothetical protein
VTQIRGYVLYETSEFTLMVPEMEARSGSTSHTDNHDPDQ